MKVFVVMGNDYPDEVFVTATQAEAYCERKRREENKVIRQLRFHWRYYQLELQGEMG